VIQLNVARMNTALLVSYPFPPMGGSGVQRALKLARYLPAAGWGVEVLTAGHARTPLLDESLERDLPSQVRVWRVGGWEPAVIAQACASPWKRRGRVPRWAAMLEQRLYWRMLRLVDRFGLPEHELLWVPAAVRRAHQLVVSGRVDCVVTTSPPNATHLVGLLLRRRLKVPWVADLRDPILDNFAYEPSGVIEDRCWRWFERAVLTQADRCVVTCPELAQRLAERYGGATDRRCGKATDERLRVVTNGFDPADAPVTGATGHESTEDRPFTVAHVGAFYRQQSVEPVLGAFRRLLADRAELAGRIRFRVVGSIAASQKRAISDADRACLEDMGYRPHRQAIGEMARADLLLLMTPANDGGRLCIPAKAFEYLAFGRHVLAVVHAGTALARWLAQAGNVTVLHHPLDEASLSAAIADCFDRWRAGQLQRPRDAGAIRRFRRDVLTGRFAAVLAECAVGRSSESLPVVATASFGEARSASDAMANPAAASRTSTENQPDAASCDSGNDWKRLLRSVGGYASSGPTKAVGTRADSYGEPRARIRASFV